MTERLRAPGWRRRAAELARAGPLLMQRLRRRLSGGGIHFTGRYDSWEAAARDAVGYRDPQILAHAAATAAAARARWERPSPADLGAQTSWPVAALLLRAAGRGEGPLGVLDFGGGLGDTYRRSRGLLDRVLDVRWAVVEQPHVAERGRVEFEESELRFFTALDDAWDWARPDVVLLSGVLQYLPVPGALLDALRARSAPAILIDRTPVVEDGADRVVVQRVPAHLHATSYPAHLFDRDTLLARLAPDYRLAIQFAAPDGDFRHQGAVVRMLGFLLERTGAGAPRP